MSNFIVTIDGPSASGKSTVSKKVAALLDCVYVDSGSLYRGLTWKVIQSGVSSEEEDAVVKVMKAMRMAFFLDAGAVRFTIDKKDPGAGLWSETVRKHVSPVAAMPQVRAWMVHQLRGMRRFGDLVMDGRDIGTVVFPETPYKFYLDADIEERARRRHRELMMKHEKLDLNDVIQSLAQRDALDSGRQTAPLKKAPGAHVIETTTMTIDEVAARIVDVVRKERVRHASMNKKPLLFRFCRCFFFLWLKAWLRYKAHGGDYVPVQGGCLIASNHASFLDPLAVCCGVLHRYVRFLARETLFRHGLTLWWANGIGVVKIDRTKGDIAALKTAIAIVKQGGVLGVFPEGTRTLDGRLQQPKGGIGFLMAKAGVPVVPAYVDGTFAAFPKGAKRVRPRKVSVFFGRPIMPSELAQFGKGKEEYKKMAELLMSRIAALKP